ncbi:hypothetical protein T07_12593 [Trichinella nelsoni]|uniref:Uncharacterized protein n=1 Tax=Trichinella nelsoni TaxID=6336 RepID=A0A0V0S795_9BILA|nr:hypothetical protein T07_12593 [Trichinella nelsoni]
MSIVTPFPCHTDPDRRSLSSLFYRSLPHRPYKELADKGLIKMCAMFAVLLSVGRCAPSTFRVFLSNMSMSTGNIT